MRPGCAAAHGRCASPARRPYSFLPSAPAGLLREGLTPALPLGKKPSTVFTQNGGRNSTQANAGTNKAALSPVWGAQSIPDLVKTLSTQWLRGEVWT